MIAPTAPTRINAVNYIFYFFEISILGSFSTIILSEFFVLGSLAPSIEALLDRETYQIYEYGFLFGRKKGLWFPVCVDVKISDVASTDFCTKIGFKYERNGSLLIFRFFACK